MLAREVGTGIGAQEVLVRLGDGDGIAGRWSLPSTGSPRAGETDRVVVDFRGEPVAELAWTRFPGDTITASDRRLMEAVALQAGPALHSATVVCELVRREAEATLRSAELEASRRRLAEAQLEAHTSSSWTCKGRSLAVFCNCPTSCAASPPVRARRRPSEARVAAHLDRGEVERFAERARREFSAVR